MTENNPEQTNSPEPVQAAPDAAPVEGQDAVGDANDDPNAAPPVEASPDDAGDGASADETGTEVETGQDDGE